MIEEYKEDYKFLKGDKRIEAIQNYSSEMERFRTPLTPIGSPHLRAAARLYQRPIIVF